MEPVMDDGLIPSQAAFPSHEGELLPDSRIQTNGERERSQASSSCASEMSAVWILLAGLLFSMYRLISDISLYIRHCGTVLIAMSRHLSST